MAVPTVITRIFPVLADGSAIPMTNYRDKVRVRYELITYTPFNGGDEIVRMRPDARLSGRWRNYVSVNGTWEFDHIAGYYDWTEVNPGATFYGQATLMKNQVHDPRSYYRLTWTFFPNTDVNLFFRTPLIDQPDNNILGGYGKQKFTKCYSIPASASGIVNMKDFQI